MIDKKSYHVLVIDDDETILLSWEFIQTKLNIEKLYCFPNLETLKASDISLETIDIAFVDKNIENSRFSCAEVLDYLKAGKVGKLVLASGESEERLREDPTFAQADFISAEKIPSSFKEFFS